MSEQLEINQSTDLLNEFLNQGGDDPIEKSIINDEGDQTVDKIIPAQPDLGLDITSELPEGFDAEPEATEPESTEVTDNDKTESQYSFKALAGYLSEEGIIDFEDSEQLEDTPEVLFESVKKTIEKEIQAYKDSIPEKAKNLFEYIEKGGDIDSYLEAIQKPFDIKKVDLTSESDQEKVVREYLKLQEYSQEEINETITDYKDSLILEKQAKVASKQLDKYFDKREQSLVETAAAEQSQKAEQYSQYISNLNTTIDTADTLAGLPITAKEKIEFKKYLLAADKSGITGYARDVAEDPIKTQVELAFLKFMKFDFSKAIKQGETKATQKLRDIFKNNEVNLKTGRSANEQNEEDSLGAFRSFLGKK